MTKLKPIDWRHLDPHYQRERRKYGDNPLPSREFILQWLAEYGKLLTIEQIIHEFGLQAPHSEHLIHRLKAMISSGQLLINRQHRIGVAAKMDLVPGYVIAHPEGYGFFNSDDDDVDGFIQPKYMQGLMHGDRILARVKHIDRQGRKDYVPVEVLERAQKRVVGKLHNRQGVWFLIPENKRLTQQVIIPHSNLANAGAEQIVVAEIVAYPTRYEMPIGKIIAVLGEEMAAGLEVAIAIENHNIPHEVPEAVQRQVDKIPETLSASDYDGRLDLRHLPMVTIDGITARDFDDAVYAEKRGNNYRLYVAIADVSHYVDRGSPLDQEAYKRGTSVYFPDCVIPMLPEKLSNGLCSLNPEVDRLVLVCELTIDDKGAIKRSKFHQAVIHSHARFTYETVEKILFEQDENLRNSFTELLSPLENLKAVYHILQAARQRRHTIEFNFAEAEFFYDGEGKIESISARERLQAHKLIEECMIVANVAAAKFLQKNKISTLYRVHDEPSEERLEKLIGYVARLGLGWEAKGSDNIQPKHFARLLEKVEQRQDKTLLEKMVLRAMSQAVYSPENRGHFGLALGSYTHFTSPIRRYPDLLVHRAIHYLLEHRSNKNYYYSPEQMAEMGKQCSMAERRADDATRDAMDFLKAEFMSHRLGEVFTGKISNIVNFGFFVTLDDYFIDGLVHVATLTSDYYHFDPENMILTGERTGQDFKMMDVVTVRVAQVSIEDRKIDFELVEHNATLAQHRQPNRKSYKKTNQAPKIKRQKRRAEAKRNKGRQAKKINTRRAAKKKQNRG